MKLNKAEMKLFMDICKEIRREQERRKRNNNERNSAYVYVSITNSYDPSCMTTPQAYAIMYALKKKGMINVHKHKYSVTRVNLTFAGFDLLKSIKETIAK